MNDAKRYIFYVVVWLGIIAATWLLGNSLSNRPAVLSADASGAILAIPRNTDGHYYIDGSINGHPVLFLVDTGASYVSVGGELASRIGLPRGVPANFGTAAGHSAGELVKGQTVSIGALTITKLSVGVNPSAGNMALLGQNFLKHVVLTQAGSKMELRFVPTPSHFLPAKPYPL